MRNAAIFALCCVSATIFGSVARAEPVVLVSKDGYTRIEGDLLKLDKDFYVVSTSVGKVKIPVADVNCEGAGCPDLTSTAPTQAELSPDQQLELFRAFLEWRKNNEDFQEFLEWRKKNAAKN